jgi:NDP-sugar pyrophosphorylase family protein
MKRAHTEAWPALVLTAGLGTRLRPLSYVRAKPAVPVAGRPLVRRILAALAQQGVRDVVLNLHHKPDTIIAAVGDPADLGLRLRYSWENPILGSAGGPRHALSLIESSQFFVVNGDTLCDVPLAALAERHLASRAQVTMALVAQPDSDRYGGAALDDAGAVTGFVKRGLPSAYHFVGVQAVNAQAFHAVPADRPAETVTSLYPTLIADHPGAVHGFVCDGPFHDIGTPADYLDTCLRLAREEHEPLPLVGRRARVHEAACVEDSVLWDDVVVDAGASLVRCVVADLVRIPEGVRFEDMAIVRRPGGYTPMTGEQIVGDLLVRQF